MALTIFQRADMRFVLVSLYGTLFDWHGSVLGALQDFGQAKGLDTDWNTFLGEWHGVLAPTMRAINAGQQPFENQQTILRRQLDTLLRDIGARNVSDDARDTLCGVWRRCAPWPDASPMLSRVSQHCLCAGLSNADLTAQIELCRNHALRLDAHLSADLLGAYKPDPRVYRRAVELLGADADRMLLVSCHNDDLAAAREAGIHTAFITRDAEHGPGQRTDLEPASDWDLVADDLVDLCDRLFP
ncbi:MAG: HAD-IA family hydrolase [Gammaproteobacteria bacterium]|nr:HAD-IA family hydrolase [Gammaproteobacteria bacterium]